MNMNPIQAKLAKMFHRGKKIQNTNHTSFLQSPNHSMLFPHQNDFSQLSTINDNLSFFHDQDTLKEMLIEVTTLRQELSEYKSKTRSLEEKIADHELLEEFYIDQLRERDEIEKELKWKLELIRGEMSKQSESTRYTVFSRVSEGPSKNYIE